MAEQPNLRRQISSWFPSWTRGGSISQRQPQRTLSRVPTSAPTRQPTEPGSASPSEQPPQLMTGEAAQQEDETPKTSPLPADSLPARRSTWTPPTSDAASPVTRTRSQRPSPAPSPDRRSQSSARTAAQKPSLSRAATKTPSPSRSTSKLSSAEKDLEPSLPSDTAPQVQAITLTSSETPPTSRNASGVLLSQKGELSPAPQPSDQEFKSLALKDIQPKDIQPQTAQPSQLEKDNSNNDETQIESNPQPTEVANKHTSDLTKIPIPDPLEKSVRPYLLSDPRQHQALEIEPDATKEKPISKLEQQQDVTSSEIPNLEKYDETKAEKVIPDHCPGQRGDSTKSPTSETKPEEIRQDKPKTTSGKTQDENSHPTKPLTKESHSKPNGLPSDSSQPKKVTSMPQTGQLERQSMVNENEPTQNGRKGKNGKLANSIKARASTSNEEKTTMQKEIKDDFSRFVQNLAIEYSKQTDCERAICIVTLAGENKGASMIIGRRNIDSESFVPISRAYNPRHNNDEAHPVNDEKNEEKNHARSEAEETNTTINSNLQSINNSILQNSTCSARDPGIHLIISNKQTEPVKENMHMKRVESNRIPVQTQTYEPIVRRRCLRGLFAESEESDTKNPQKPRRHGCRFRCE